jgi:hypothetical protein
MILLTQENKFSEGIIMNLRPTVERAIAELDKLLPICTQLYSEIIYYKNKLLEVLYEFDRYGELDSRTMEEVPHYLDEGAMLIDRCE